MLSPKFLYAPLETKLHTTLRNNCMQEITQLYYLTATCFLLVSLHDFKEEKIVADLYLYLRDVKIFLYRQKNLTYFEVYSLFFKKKNVCVKWMVLIFWEYIRVFWRILYVFFLGKSLLWHLDQQENYKFCKLFSSW